MSSEDEELVAFLKARLDEDEAAARYSGPARVAWLTLRDDGGKLRYTTVAATSGDSDDVWCADGRELGEPASVRVIYDPARALREVGTGRMLLRERERLAHRREILAGNLRASEHWTPYTAPGYPGRYDMEREGHALDALDHFLAGLIRTRAAAYSDHPDYRAQAWKP